MISKHTLRGGFIGVVLSMAFLADALPRDADQEEQHSAVGTWKLTSDWGKGDDGKGTHLLTVKSDLSGTIKDVTKGGTSELKEVRSSGESLSFRFFHGEKEAFEIKFTGSVAENEMKGNFSVFGAKAVVVGSPVTAAEAKSIVGQPSVSGSYEARQFTSSDGETLHYRLFIPKTDKPKETDKAKEKYPLVLSHHGGGGAGNDNLSQLEGACAREWILPKVQEAYPCFIVAPQFPGKTKKRPSKEAAMETMKRRIQAIHEILDALEKEFSIDQSREYVTGLSFGGECTWLSLIERPDRFAAAVPICAGDKLMDVTAAERGKQFAQLPLWIVHGDADKVISVDVSREVVQALKDAGGDPKYTEYPGVGHNSWDRAYRDPELIEWLFGQSRPRS